MPLKIIAPQRLYRQIANHIRDLISAEKWAVGARLPAERDLAHQLGVSRPSVREALIALEVEAWVEVRIGSGVYVLARSDKAVNSKITDEEWGPLELIRARRMLEGETAAMAATCASPKQLAAMRKAIKSMQSDSQRGLAPLKGDRAFHSAVTSACGNAVLQDTIEGFWDSRHNPLFERLGQHFETQDAWQSAIEEHQAILHAIARQDASAARLAMQAHMDKSHARFSASWRGSKTRSKRVANT
jgi:DNA-binding FadR family transcriptional regulator